MPPQRRDWLRHHAPKIIAVTIWLTIAAAAWLYWLRTGLPLREFIAQLADRVTALIAGRWYGPLVYIVIYVLRPLTLFSSTVLTVVAGNVYGLWWGYFWALVAGTLSSILPYYIGRWVFARPSAAVSNDGLGRLQQFTALLRQHPFEAVLTMRLLRLPYDTVTVFAAGLGVRSGMFFAATFLGNVVGALPYVILGASVKGNPFTQDAEFQPWMFVFSAVLYLVGIGLSRLLRRFRREEASPARAGESPNQ